MKFTIDRTRLETVQERLDVVRPKAPAQQSESGAGPTKTWKRGSAVVSEVILAETLAGHPDCHCEEVAGLRAGMPADELIELESGCKGSQYRDGQPGWVCARLDAVRRRCGK